MLEYYLTGAGLRLAQVVIHASLWIVIGCFVAAIFRRMLGPEKVRKIFANNTRWGLLVGWLMGMLLPVCSLGVIPVVREMHRAGVSRGTIVAFGLTAPLFNPMSVLYGLTLSDPIAIISFSFCALIVVSFVGFIWNRWLTGSLPEAKGADEPMPTIGLRRSASVLYTTAKEIAGPAMIFILIGILGSVLTAAFFEKGLLQNQVERDNWMAPIVVALIGTPVYSTPLLAMSQIGSMFQHGNSVGAAFSLLILGAGANLGLLAWFAYTYGFRRFIAFFLLLSSITVGLAYIVDKPLYPKGVDPAGHTHAFDVYTHPFKYGESNLTDLALTKLDDFWRTNEYGGTYVLAALLVIGLGLLAISQRFDFEAWFQSGTYEKTKFDRIIPGWFIGMVAVTGLVISSIVGCYVYYPDADDLLSDLTIVNTECVIAAKTKQWEAAEKWIQYSDDLSRRLEVGVYLRKGSVSEFQTAKAKVYREKLDTLRHAVEDQDASNINRQAMDVAKAYLRMSEAFRTRDKVGFPPKSDE